MGLTSVNGCVHLNTIIDKKIGDRGADRQSGLTKAKPSIILECIQSPAIVYNPQNLPW
jgi:hypothetical protein